MTGYSEDMELNVEAEIYSTYSGMDCACIGCPTSSKDAEHEVTTLSIAGIDITPSGDAEKNSAKLRAIFCKIGDKVIPDYVEYVS